MSVVIRLKSIGTKKKIKHRIVVTDTRFPRDGRFLEEVGYWDPATKPTTVKVKQDRIAEWIKNGAKPSDTVKSILKKAGVPTAAEKTAAPKVKKAKTEKKS